MCIYSFLEDRLYEIANELLKKANLHQTTHFTTVPHPKISSANAFELLNRVIYSIPDRMFKRYLQNIPYLLFHGIGINKQNLLSYMTICIAHEVGHALQENLVETVTMLRYLKSSDVLKTLNTPQELQDHVKIYRNLLVSLEEDAWERAWRLLSDKITKKTFDIVKNKSLSTYQKENYLETEKEFHFTYLSLTC